MLDADVLLVAGVPGVGDIARGVDIGDVGLEVLVDEDAVVDPEPGRLIGQLGSRGDADADDHDICGLDATVAEDDLLDVLATP